MSLVMRVMLAGDKPDCRARSARDVGPWTNRSTRIDLDASDSAGHRGSEFPATADPKVSIMTKLSHGPVELLRQGHRSGTQTE